MDLTLSLFVWRQEVRVMLGLHRPGIGVTGGKVVLPCECVNYRVTMAFYFLFVHLMYQNGQHCSNWDKEHA